MAMGAFPIQTNTSCCDEWFEDGEGGFIIPPDDFETICDRFGRALSDDVLVDRAADVNWKTVEARLDFRVLQGEVGRFYRMIFDGSLIAAHAASAGESG
jgi:glycosyltransferase involved in cell wall biosynthesis